MTSYSALLLWLPADNPGRRGWVNRQAADGDYRKLQHWSNRKRKIASLKEKALHAHARTRGSKNDELAAQFHGQSSLQTTKRANGFCPISRVNLPRPRVNLTQNACNPRIAAHTANSAGSNALARSLKT
jgi:hypothetical protein